MAGWYFLTLALLVGVAFLMGRFRANALASGARSTLHSLPIYHGLLAAAAVLTPMLAVYAVGAPVVDWLATKNALGVFGPDVASDALKRAVAIRDIQNVATGQHSGQPSAALAEATSTYLSVLQSGRWIVFGVGFGLGLAGLTLTLSRIGREFRSRNYFRALRVRRAVGLRGRGRVHDAGHRAVSAVRILSLLL